MPKSMPTLSVEEFRSLPLVVGTSDYARIYGCSARFASNNAPSLGATRIGGKWRWSKAKIAADLGLTLDA